MAQDLRNIVIASPLTGAVVSLARVPDATFASGILGDGIAIEPSEGKLYSPVDGTVETVFDTRHALCIVSAGGAEILVHVGQDTVALGGEHFTAHVKDGETVTRGQLLLEFDRTAIAAAGFLLTTPVTIGNSDEYHVEKVALTDVCHGDALLTLIAK